MRHKLIPTRGRKLARYVHGRDQALEEAREQFRDTEIPVLVVEFPEGGVVTPVATIGADPKAKRR